MYLLNYIQFLKLNNNKKKKKKKKIFEYNSFW